MLFFLKEKRSVRSTKEYGYLLYTIFYLIHLIGLIYSDSFSEVQIELQKKISLLAIPLAFFITPQLTKEIRRYLLMGFVSACLLAGVACLLGAVYQFIRDSDSTCFFYHPLASNIGMSAIYLSLYFNFALIIILHFFTYKETKLSLKAFFIFTLLFFSTMIFLLSSRTQISIFMCIFMISAFIYLKNTYGYLISITVSILLSLLVLGTVLMIPTSRERFKQAINYNSEYTVSTKWGDSQIRYLIWDSSLELILTHFGTGVGTGDVQEALQVTYVRSKRTTLTYFSDVQYNAHNQFLETTIALGLGGLVVLLALFLLPLGYASRTKNSLHATFLLVFFASCMTESMLERQNGIVFYAFFNALLFGYSINSKNNH